MEKYIVKIQVQPQYLNVFKVFYDNTGSFIRLLSDSSIKKLQKNKRFPMSVCFKSSWLKKEGFLTDNNLPEIESNQVKLLPNGTVRILSPPCLELDWRHALVLWRNFHFLARLGINLSYRRSIAWLRRMYNVALGASECTFTRWHGLWTLKG